MLGLAQTKTNDIIGVWLTAGKEPAKVEIFESGNKYYGKIIWLKYSTENNKPKEKAYKVFRGTYK